MEQINDLEFADLKEIIISLGEPGYRVNQIWEGLYKHLYTNWNEFTNIPNSLIATLSHRFIILPIKLINEEKTSDGNTVKMLFQLKDGLFIESVHLVNRDRNTICISTQAGCPVGCHFCATGKVGFFRNLSASEIIGQIIFFSNRLQRLDQKIQNIVLMGMGEPFLNYDATLKAVRRFNDSTGLDLGARRITISTIGIVEKIKAFAEENRQFNLAISLHAPNDQIRQKLIPIAAKYPLAEIFKAADYYISKTNRRITYEYVLIDKINSTSEHAQELANKIKHQNCHVNLIALNANSHFDGNPPDDDSINKFSKVLLNSRIPTTIRNSQGSKIKAGCGQLAGTQHLI